MKSLEVVPSSGMDISPFIPPQRLWPMTTMFSTFRCNTAYSMAAPTPECFVWSYGGTMLAIFRTIKASPG
uniref:Carbonic anhydrase 2 isoform X1 n=1 Tax=Rhizophora mucronata TaxID=61149 RepID=A0A2P2LBZ6_RHIMU